MTPESKAMKETEEATLDRLFKLYAEYSGGMAYKNIAQLIELSGPEGTKKLICSIAKDYHQERLKSSLPSEQEIRKALGPYDSKVEIQAYRKGFKDALTLLTKGDR